MFVATRKRKTSPPATRSTVKNLKKPVTGHGQSNRRHFGATRVFFLAVVLLLGLGSLGLRACQQQDGCRHVVDEYQSTLLSRGATAAWVAHFQTTRGLIQDHASHWFQHHTKRLLLDNAYISTAWRSLDDYIHNRHRKMPILVKDKTHHDATAVMEETLRQRVHHWVRDIKNDDRRKEMEDMAWHMIRQVRQEHLASAAAKISSASPSEHLQSLAAQPSPSSPTS